MARVVRVNTGMKNIQLPDGGHYDGQVDVTLTDVQFAQIAAAAFTGGSPILTDLGPAADPGEGTTTVVNQAANVAAQGALTSSAPAALTSSAPAAVTSSQESTVNGSDLATTQALANSLKTKYNAAQADIAALRTTLAATQADVAALRTTLAAVVTDVASGQAKLNAALAALTGANKPMAAP